MPRLGALGTLVWDRIWHPAHVEPSEQWGGLTYSLAALDATCPSGWQVVPLIRVGDDLVEPALAMLRQMRHLELETGLQLVAHPNNRVELRYHDAARRCERLEGGVPPWEWSELAPRVRTLDALYVNFISGFELDLSTARRLRDAFSGFLHADLHSLFLGPAEEGARQPRPLPDAEAWLGCFDTVQLNEQELMLLVGEHGTDADLAGLLDLGPSLVVVTQGERGARYAVREGLPANPLAWRSASRRGNAVRTGWVAPPAGPLAGDPTGCGDVWGSALFTGLLAGARLDDAIERAHRLAACKIRHPTTAALPRALRSCLAAEPSG